MAQFCAVGVTMKDFVAESRMRFLAGDVQVLAAGAKKATRCTYPFVGQQNQGMSAANVNANLRFDAEKRQCPSDCKAAQKTGRVSYASIGKRALDLILVILALPVALPIILLSAVALWCESGLPFYTQERLGQNGRRFLIYKLRTMVRDAESRLQEYLDRDPALRQEWDDTQKLKNDPRITLVGRILRMTSMDELPQLWNVLTGDMSLVGPRPMMPEQLPLYGDASAYFAVKPGITGLWQVSVRNESSFASRSKADADYLRGMGLQLDLTLIWRTFGVVARGTGY